MDSSANRQVPEGGSSESLASSSQNVTSSRTDSHLSELIQLMERKSLQENSSQEDAESVTAQNKDHKKAELERISRRLKLLSLRKNRDEARAERKRKRLEKLREAETESNYAVARLDSRVELLDMFVSKIFVDESFLGRKELNPWKFKNSERLTKKWDFVNDVMITQELMVAVRDAKNRRSENRHNSEESSKQPSIPERGSPEGESDTEKRANEINSNDKGKRTILKNGKKLVGKSSKTKLKFADSEDEINKDHVEESTAIPTNENNKGEDIVPVIQENQHETVPELEPTPEEVEEKEVPTQSKAEAEDKTKPFTAVVHHINETAPKKSIVLRKLVIHPPKQHDDLNSCAVVYAFGSTHRRDRCTYCRIVSDNSNDNGFLHHPPKAPISPKANKQPSPVDMTHRIHDVRDIYEPSVMEQRFKQKLQGRVAEIDQNAKLKEERLTSKILMQDNVGNGHVISKIQPRPPSNTKPHLEHRR